MKSALKFVIILIASIVSFCEMNAQNSVSTKWSAKFEPNKSFIENKGQFSIPPSFGNPGEVLFAVDHRGTKIFFTKQGITYTLLETLYKPKDAREIERERREEFKDAEAHMRHEKEEHELKIKTDQATMLWENANTNVEIIGSELTSDYHSYYFKQPDGEYKNASNIKGYKKITYKNIYPNIDIDYVFSEKDGLKYSIILHPGADPNMVKMVYDNHVSLKNNGEIHIDTKFGDIIDHAPLTFYEQNSSSVITSSFIKTGKTVSFQLANYDNTQTVVIDPWTQTPAFTSNWDCVWECEKDGAGNVYIIGGVTPMQLLKYNSAGALQWTYNTPYDTTSWIGTFATDNAGNSFVTRGSVAAIQKIDNTGALVWNNNGGGSVGSSDEYWNIAFNCDQTKLIVGGTSGAFGLPVVLKGTIFDINTSNGVVLNTKIVAYGSTSSFPPSVQEVRSITPCGNGRYYFLTLDSIGYINQNFSLCASNPAVFKTTSTHGFSYKCENFRKNNTGIMAIKADLNFVYTHNGTTLFKRSLTNASIIASVAIPGGAATTSLGQKMASCSGIDIDASGNIYVGSTNAVTKFSPALVQLGTVAVPFNVYDVHVSTAGDVIACGSTGNSGSASRSGYIQSISSLSAGTTLSLICCDANICQPPTKCVSGAAFNLTAATAGGTWSGTGITNAANGTFNPATAGVGSHVITYSLACGVGTTTVIVSACTLSLCINSGSLTASGGGGNYTWASTTTTVDCSSCPGGSCIPGFCSGVTVPTWTASGVTVTAPAASVFPIKVTDVTSGITYTFTTLAGIPSCSVSSCPTLTMAVTSQTNINCFGTNTGSATVSSSSGVGPYSYTWTPGNLNGASQTGLAAGNYTIAIKDANLCPGTGTLTITQPTAALTAAISATTATGCGATTGGATVTASSGTPSYTYSWSPSGGTTAGVSNLGAGNNTVTITDSKGCTKTVVANITTSGGPTLSVVSQTNVNCFGTNTGSATVNGGGGTGPYSYTWTPGNLTGASQSSLAAGTYTINAQDANLCSGTTTLTITQPTAALTAVISATTTTGCGASAGGATVTASSGTPSYTYSWSPSGGTTAGVSNLGAGNNTVTVTDSKGCTKTVVANITTSGGPTLSVVSQTNVNCFGTNTGTATVNAGGGTGPYSYTWSPGNLMGASQASLSAGTYTINAQDANLCAGTTTLTITQPTAALTGVISGTTAAGCGASTGGATVTATGGTPSYTYSWSPSGGTTAGVSNLGAGNNTVTVTDSKGCTKTAVANITTSGGPTLSVVSQTNVNCFGANTGTATVNAGGGTGPYSYTWTPGNLIGAGQVSLSAGIYTINAQDANLCAGTTTLTITQPTAALTAVISATTAAGCGASTGGATVTANGGIPSYTYSWSPSGGTTAGGSNLGAGNNTVTVTDSKGCTKTVVVNITTSGGPTLSVVSQTNVNCFGANTGTATVNAGGGTGPYSYTWTPGNLIGASQSSLSAGTYTINIKDNNLCAGTGTLLISQPVAPVSAFISNSPTGCGTSVGSATVTPGGGTSSYTYSWSPSGGNAAIASNLAAGNYSVTVKDSKNCQITAVTTINTTPGGPTLSVASQTNVLCNSGATGSASISASGTSGPFSYTWSPTGGNAASASGLTAGTYTIGVKDASACMSTITVNISQPTAITLTLSTTPATCGSVDGTATVNANGGNGTLTPLWNTGSNNNAITGLISGSYNVMVTDANNCSVTATCIVSSIGSLTVNPGPDATINAGESTLLTAVVPSSATVIWSPSGSLGCATCTSTTASPMVTTTYTITTFLNGCTGTGSVTVFVDIVCGELFIPSAFSPNDDGQNDVLYVMGNCIENLEFAIFDRWGEKVFESTNPAFGWDGTFNGKKMTPAAFAYYLRAIVNGQNINKKGNISLVK